MVSERLDIVVNERGARVVSKRISDIGGASKETSKQIGSLKSSLIAIGGALFIRQITQYADTYTNLQNRLKLVTNGTKNLASVTDELFEISNRTRSSFAATGELYARTALATRELGISQKVTLQFTESLNQAVILSGASAQEASAGIIQLSQGLASGTLRGDELRSVLEQLPAVADVIAKSLGVTRGELRKLGEQGKITARDIVKAFEESREELADKFSRTVPTIGQAFTVLGNNIIKIIGEFGDSTGITKTLSGGIILLANSISFLTKTIVVSTAAIVTYKALLAGSSINLFLVGVIASTQALVANTVALFKNNAIGVLSLELKVQQSAAELSLAAAQVARLKTTAALTGGSVLLARAEANLIATEVSHAGVVAQLATAQAAATASTLTLAGAMARLRAIIVSTSLTAFLVPLVAIISAIVLFKDEIKVSSKGVATLSDLIDELGQSFSDAKGLIFGFNEELDKATESDFDLSIENTLRGIAVAVDTVLGTLIGTFKAVFDGLETLFNSTLTAIKIGLNETGLFDLEVDPSNLRTAGEIGKEMAESFKVGFSFNDTEKALDVFLKKVESNATKSAEQIRNLKDAQSEAGFFEALDFLEKENELLSLNSIEREGVISLLKIEKKFKTELTDQQAILIVGILEENEALKSLNDTFESIVEPQREVVAEMERLDFLFLSGAIGIDQYSVALRKVDSANISLANSISTLEAQLTRDPFKVDLERIDQDLARRQNLIEKGVADGVITTTKGKELEDKVVKDSEESRFRSSAKANAKTFQDTSQFFSNLGDVAQAFGEQSKSQQKKAFKIAQASRIAGVIANTAAGIARGYAEFPFPVATAFAAVTAAAGALQLSTVQSQKFADGGLVSGPGGPRDDTVSARLSNGEFVVNAADTARNLSLLKSINRGQKPKLSSNAPSQPFSNTGVNDNGANVNIIVNNQVAGTITDVETTETDNGVDVTLLVRQVSEGLATDFNNGAGPLTKAIKNSQKRGF